MRAQDAGGDGELCYLDGAFVPFAKTKAEREAKDDPRPRWRSAIATAPTTRHGAASRARSSSDGYLLPEDVKRIAARASSAAW